MSDTNNKAISNVIQENIDTKDYIADAYSEAFRKDETSFPTDGVLNSENLPDTILRIKTFKNGLAGNDGPRIFAERGTLEENDPEKDLDNIKNNNGIYFLEEGKEYDNIPSEAKNTNQKLKDNAILKIIVNDSETQIRQELFVGEQVFVRKGFKNTNDINIDWSIWEEVTPLRIKNTNSSTKDNATDPNTIYNYNNGEGYIITSTAGNKQTQYYFANDGGFRYRCRKRDDVNDNWGNWPKEFKHISSDNIINFESISNLTALNDRITPLDTQTIYGFNNGQGFIFSSVVSNKETQYYFAEDGVLRYRTRKLANGKGEKWTQQFTTYPTNETVMRYAESSSMDNYTEQTIYKYPSHGLIIPVTTSDKQAQYYLPEDGVLRYRYKTTNGNWVNGGKFLVMVNEENINEHLSPQNRADKYFLKTCVNKSKVKINSNTQILAFGDSITAGNTYSDWLSWLKPLKDEIGCPTPYNLAVSGASFGVNDYSPAGSNKLMYKQLETLDTLINTQNEQHINLETIDLIIIAAGTNDAFNNTPISGNDSTAFAQAVYSFVVTLKEKFSTAGIDCPPILFITPIRRGSKANIDASGEDNVEIKLAKYGAVICNIALSEGCSVINGFDIPIITDDIEITDKNNNKKILQSFMNSKDGQHLHPKYEGLKIYAQSILSIIGESATIDSELSNVSENPVQNKVIQQTLSTKENISNKATSLDSPSDETYPTTKVVSDALDNINNYINSNIQEKGIDNSSYALGKRFVIQNYGKINEISSFNYFSILIPYEETVPFKIQFNNSNYQWKCYSYKVNPNESFKIDNVFNEESERNKLSVTEAIQPSFKLCSENSLDIITNSKNSDYYCISFKKDDNSSFNDEEIKNIIQSLKINFIQINIKDAFNGFIDETLSYNGKAADAKTVGDILDTKENISNKATSLDSPSDETYPTTKVVSDTLDTKADKINSFMFKKLPATDTTTIEIEEEEVEVQYIDLNKIKEEGHYLLFSTSYYSNAPSSTNQNFIVKDENFEGVLEVYKNFYNTSSGQSRYIFYQRVITTKGSIYIRRSNSYVEDEDDSNSIPTYFGWKCQKATSLNDPSDETYPTTKAVSDALSTIIDNSLSQSGQAADAKTVGDAFNYINSSIQEKKIENFTADSLGFTINNSGGIRGEAGTRYYSILIPCEKDKPCKIKLNLNNNYLWRSCFCISETTINNNIFESNINQLTLIPIRLEWKSCSEPFIINNFPTDNKECYYFISFYNQSDNFDTDINDIKDSLVIETVKINKIDNFDGFIDETLSYNGKAADAKTVGDVLKNSFMFKNLPSPQNVQINGENIEYIDLNKVKEEGHYLLFSNQYYSNAPSSTAQNLYVKDENFRGVLEVFKSLYDIKDNKPRYMIFQRIITEDKKIYLRHSTIAQEFDNSHNWKCINLEDSSNKATSLDICSNETYPTTQAVRNALDKLVNDMEVEQNIYNNTYNITSNPTITTDENNFLAATNDSDCSNSIRSMLNQTGCCILGPGDFYIKSGIELPENSMIRGQGNKTRVIWNTPNPAENSYMFKLQDLCSLSDMQILGSTQKERNNMLNYIGNNKLIGNLTGILIQGAYGEKTTDTEGNEITDTTQGPSFCTLSNLFVKCIPGCGLKMVRTGMKVYAHTQIVNCNFRYCDCGIYDGTQSEFHMYSNVDCGYNYYGVICKGGNNRFSNCSFSGNCIGVYLDCKNEPNNAHGIFVGCEIVHSFGTLEDARILNPSADIGNSASKYCGKGIICDGVSTSEIFDSCQIGYGKIDIIDSNSIKFQNCAIGRHSYITLNNANKFTLSNCSIGDEMKISEAEGSVNKNINIINCLTNGKPVAITHHRSKNTKDEEIDFWNDKLPFPGTFNNTMIEWRFDEVNNKYKAYLSSDDTALTWFELYKCFHYGLNIINRIIETNNEKYSVQGKFKFKFNSNGKLLSCSYFDDELTSEKEITIENDSSIAYLEL